MSRVRVQSRSVLWLHETREDLGLNLTEHLTNRDESFTGGEEEENTSRSDEQQHLSITSRERRRARKEVCERQRLQPDIF